MTALRQWGDEWIYGDGHEPLLIEHRSCGCITTGQMTCSACGEALDVRSVPPRYRGPAARATTCETSAGHDVAARRRLTGRRASRRTRAPSRETAQAVAPDNTDIPRRSERVLDRRLGRLG